LRHTIDDPDYQFDFHMEIDRIRRERELKATQKAEREAKEKLEKEEHDRQQRFFLGRSAADKLLEAQREREHNEMLKAQKALLKQKTRAATEELKTADTTPTSADREDGPVHCNTPLSCDFALYDPPNNSSVAISLCAVSLRRVAEILPA
jgi:hypothetical protein